MNTSNSNNTPTIDAPSLEEMFKHIQQRSEGKYVLYCPNGDVYIKDSFEALMQAVAPRHWSLIKPGILTGKPGVLYP